MKTLLTILILFFFSSVVAEDISDFQIEGMSLGDSLLDYFSEEDINNNYSFGYKNDEYIANVLDNNNHMFYDSLEVVYKNNDPNYIIYMITGLIFYENDSTSCRNKKNEIALDVKKIFDEDIEIENNNKNHSYDLSGNSKSYRSSIKFKSGDRIDVSCYIWGKEIKRKHPNWSDNARVDIVDHRFVKWLHEVHYK